MRDGESVICNTLERKQKANRALIYIQHRESRKVHILRGKMWATCAQATHMCTSFTLN